MGACVRQAPAWAWVPWSDLWPRLPSKQGSSSFTVTLKTCGLLPLRSGMKTDVWPWKDVPAPIRAKIMPQERL